MRSLAGRLLTAFVLLACIPAPAMADERPRLFVLTDVGNEPDDQMSLVRLLVYSNEIAIEGVGAVTSTWQKDTLHPEIARNAIAAYGSVRPSLMRHADGWATAAALLARVSDGVKGYGLAALATAPPSPAAEALIAAAQRDDPRPLWVALWGGANTLAQALQLAQARLDHAAFDALLAKMRVYSISDQDDGGPWIRAHYPTLFYIVSPSTPDGSEYARATWTGISGDRFYRNGQGADFTTVDNDWLDRNIRSKGPLGAHYPRYMFIMEGDTPSFLGLIPTGLQNGDRPDWGGWGGRYLLRQPFGESRPIWTQGGDSFVRTTSADTVDGITSDQATVWRWREAFQNDFAARMDWTVKPFPKANHPPKVVIDGAAGDAPVRATAHTGSRLMFDASASSDPDRDELQFRWFAYPEAGFTGTAPTALVRIDQETSPRAAVTVISRCAPAWLDLVPCPKHNRVHVVLAVTDRGSPVLTRYRRIILEVSDK